MAEKLNVKGCRNLVSAIMYRAICDAAYGNTIDRRIGAYSWIYGPVSKHYATILGVEAWPPPQRAYGFAFDKWQSPLKYMDSNKESCAS